MNNPDYQSNYAINTKEVYELLYSKWAFENIELPNDLYKTVQRAIEDLLQMNNVQSFHDWDNDYGLLDYVFNRYPTEQKRSRQPDSFPIPRFIVFHKNIGAQDAEIITGREGEEEKANFKHILNTYRILFLDADNYFLKRSDKHFGLLFSVQMFLTDIEEMQAFLNYHLLETYKNDIEEYTNFLEAISIKYKKEIGEGILPIVNRFFSKLNSEIKIGMKQIKEIEPEILNKEVTVRRQVLAMKYLFDELPVDNNKIAMADFIKMLTGKEATQKTKDGNIYKVVKKPLPISDKTLTDDLRFIRPFFENLGLTSIVDTINKEIKAKEKD